MKEKTLSQKNLEQFESTDSWLTGPTVFITEVIL